ncbi:hypothetical protein BDZ89DRAFT_1039016 [Hymenopellis radicata]|nr:hypothetical protein BDZ89DRAFT_1039016 [Hymenopellis radicata]
MSMPTTTTEAVTPILGVTASVQSSVDAAMDPTSLPTWTTSNSCPMPSVDADLQAHLPLVGDPALNVLHARSASVNGIVGVVYDTVPLSMAYNAEVVADRYYVVSKGRRVGIVTEPAIATALITGIPGGSNKHYETQQKAVDLYKYDIFVLAPHLTLSSPLMAASAFEQELEQEFNRYDKFLSELDPVALDAALDGHISSILLYPSSSMLISISLAPENDLDLVDALEGLSLYATPPQTPPRTPTRLSPPLTQYRLLSPTRKAGIPETTEHWSKAADIVNNYPDVKVTAETRRPKKKRRSKHWVVFAGRQTGYCLTPPSREDVAVQIAGVPSVTQDMLPRLLPRKHSPTPEHVDGSHMISTSRLQPLCSTFHSSPPYALGYI